MKKKKILMSCDICNEKCPITQVLDILNGDYIVLTIHVYRAVYLVVAESNN